MSSIVVGRKSCRTTNLSPFVLLRVKSVADLIRLYIAILRNLSTPAKCPVLAMQSKCRIKTGHHVHWTLSNLFLLLPFLLHYVKCCCLQGSTKTNRIHDCRRRPRRWHISLINSVDSSPPWPYNVKPTTVMLKLNSLSLSTLPAKVTFTIAALIFWAGELEIGQLSWAEAASSNE